MLFRSIRKMSKQVSRGSAGEYQADERADVARLSWRVSGRRVGRYRAAQLGAVQRLRRQLLTWKFRRSSACASVRVAGEEGSLTTRKFEYHSSMECDLMETDILESLEDLG